MFLPPRSFWQATSPLLAYKRHLVLGLLAMAVSSACLGAGLGLLLPAFQFLLGERRSISELIRTWGHQTEIPGVIQSTAFRIADQIPSDPFWSFVVVMALIAGIGIIANLARYFHNLMSFAVVLQATRDWRAKLFSHLLRLPLARFQVAGSADYMSRIVSDTNVLAQGYRSLLGKSVADAFRGVAALSVAMVLDWRLSSLTLAVALPISVLISRFSRAVRQASRRALESMGQVIGVVQEALLGIATVKVDQAEGDEEKRFGEVNDDLFIRQLSARNIKALAAPAVETMTLITVVSVASLAAWYILRRDVESSSFMTWLIALTVAAQSVRGLSKVSQIFNESAAAAERMMAVIGLPVETNSVQAAAQVACLPRHSRTVAFEYVTYTYPNRSQPALKEFSVKVSYGQMVAIVGPNGSGKTTLICHLPRLLEPESGRILIDGVDIAGVKMESLRRQMAMVTQEPLFFRGTITRNIAHGCPHASRQQIVSAARAAHAHDFIQKMPRGYETDLGELGVGLSSGQKQRLAIARALLRDPAILILDEPTSQIDPDSESKIARVLADLRGSRTTLVVTHRLYTARIADLILVMHEGRLEEMGTHDRLIRECETYRRLVEAELPKLRSESDPGREDKVSGAG